MRPKTFALALVVVLAISASLALASHYHVFAVSQNLLLLSRWAFIAVLAGYALRRRSMTSWILFAMVAGAEIGHDWPQTANAMRLISQIFLRLIRVIIAPLLFATLVSGIAAHADLKKIGRMGLKAILYFEIVTTLALFIGLGAINLSKAGVGVHLPPAAADEGLKAAHMTVSEIILHIFPENIAKSVAGTRSCRW
jgi:proton glutamate symport protein